MSDTRGLRLTALAIWIMIVVIDLGFIWWYHGDLRQLPVEGFIGLCTANGLFVGILIALSFAILEEMK